MSLLVFVICVPSPSLVEGLTDYLDPPRPGDRLLLKRHRNLLPSMLQGASSRRTETYEMSLLDLPRSSIMTKASFQTAKARGDGGEVQKHGSGFVSVKACDILS